MKRIDKILAQYTKNTGIYSLKVDTQAELIGVDLNDWICRSYYCKNQSKCLRDHQLVLNESYRLGSLFIHLCHQDFVIWGIPLTQNRKIVGGVLSGFRLFEQYKHREKEYLDDFAISINQELYITSEDVRTLSEQQFEMMKQANLYDLDLFELLQKRAQIQTDIAEKIIERKHKGEYGNALIYQKQEQLLNSIRLAEIGQIRSNFHAVLSEIYIEAITNLDLLKFRMLELFVLISRTILEVGGNVDDFYHLTNQYSKNTEGLDDIYTFSLWLTDVLDKFIGTVIRKRQKLGNVSRAVDYIHNNLSRKLTIDEVSSEVGMSRSRFSAAFHKETGMTFSTFLANCRVEKAKKILNNTVFNLSEIASELGFFDQSHFTRTFKKITGVTPSQYAKSGSI